MAGLEFLSDGPWPHRMNEMARACMPLLPMIFRRENDFVQHEALAHELASRFYSARGFGIIAQAYLRNARYGYLRWGADGKVRQLDQLHPHLRPDETGAAQTGTIGVPLEQLEPVRGIPMSVDIDDAARRPARWRRMIASSSGTLSHRLILRLRLLAFHRMGISAAALAFGWYRSSAARTNGFKAVRCERPIPDSYGSNDEAALVHYGSRRLS